MLKWLDSNTVWDTFIVSAVFNLFGSVVTNLRYIAISILLLEKPSDIISIWYMIKWISNYGTWNKTLSDTFTIIIIQYCEASPEVRTVYRG